MKILLVIDNLNSGGAQRQLVNLGLGLKENGNKVDFLIYNKGHHFEHILQDNNINIYKFYKRNKYDLFSLIRAIRFMKRKKYNAIGAFLFVPSLYVLLFKVFTMSKTKVLVSERSFYSKNKEGNKERMIRKLYAFADIITVNSISQTNYLKSRFPRLEKKIVYIPNGLMIDNFDVKKQDVSSNDIKIVSVGHVNANKNTKLLIKAVKILRDEHDIKVNVQWLGRTYEFLNQKNDYFEECKALISECNLRNNWTWAGKVKDVQKHLLTSDLLIHPSIGEGFPNAICESLACGLPVIASKVNDHPYIVKDYFNGFLFESNNLEQLIDKIIVFKNLSLDDKRRMEIEARKTAENNFRLSNMINKYSEMFNA